MTALLFADFESTSLNVATATLLEGAWAVTDLDGTLRTPLRSRYLMIAPEDERPVIPDGSGWHPAGGQLAALQMAEASGLHADWQASSAAACLERAGDLERLILDDVLSSCEPARGDEPAETVHICGAGAARFDFSLLRLHCSNLVPSPGQRWPVHYRPVDVSGNQTGLLGNNYERKMIGWYLQEFGDEDTHPEGPNLGIDLGTWPSFSYHDRFVYRWLVNDTFRHRAAPDVARSIIIQRALWIYGRDLRAELGVTDDGSS